MTSRSVSRRSSGASNNAAADNSPNKKPKRRNERNILTFYEKIAVIRYYDETNISRNSLAKMFHCCATQIRRILEKKQELLQQLVSLSEADASIIIEEMTRKRRKFEMSAISFILHQWVERNRQLRLCKPITNETLKETATKMAAILNLPSFRPSYRWLNRFRGKYKYNDEDLSAGQQGIVGELAVEDIIIEFKDSLPSFMQKEILAITSSAKDEETSATQMAAAAAVSECKQNDVKRAEVPVLLNDNSMDDFEITDEDDDEEETEDTNMIESSAAVSNNYKINSKSNHSVSANNNDDHRHDVVENDDDDNSDDDVIEIISKESNNNNSDNSAKKESFQTQEFPLNAGSAALLHSIFPHLAVIHQFALLNSDVKALEMISQLGVHMQTQANQGAYKQLSLATSNDLPPNGDMYADIDDIVLVE